MCISTIFSFVQDSSTKPKPLLKLLAHNGDVDDLDISPDGRTIVSIGHDAHVYLWAMNDGKKLMELPHLTDIGKQFRVLISNLFLSFLFDSFDV